MSLPGLEKIYDDMVVNLLLFLTIEKMHNKNRDWQMPVSVHLRIHRFHVLRLVPSQSIPADEHLLLLII